MTRKSGVAWAFAVSAGVFAVIATAWAIADGAQPIVVLGVSVCGAVIGVVLVALALQILKLLVAISGGLGLDEDGPNLHRVRAVVRWSDGLLDDIQATSGTSLAPLAPERPPRMVTTLDSCGMVNA